ncbi:MAG: hypothetical protein ABI405_01350 [Parafilimonas sp.]
MKNFFLVFVLIISSLLIILTISTCTREYSYEGGPGAVYNLTGSPDECVNAIINGNYAVEIPVDSLNNVQVTAAVTTAGNYTISTNAIDGITFSASGNFPDTGFYTIILKASGIPASAGSFQVQILGNNGCSFPLEVKGKPSADYELSGNLNDCENPDIQGSYEEAMILSATNVVIINVDVFTAGDYTITTDTADGIFFSASGTFNTTGTQQVTLTGNGTPNAAGLIYFKVYAGASECDFKIPVRNFSPVATYVLQSGFGNPNPCTPHTVNGNYVTAIPLTSANTMDITAYVTVIGNFNISTDSTNGMIFSYSGKFTATGDQTVTLYGSGTPVKAGIYTFIPQIIGPAPLGGNSCGVDVTTQ